MRRLCLKRLFHLSIMVALLPTFLRGLGLVADFSGLLYGLAATGVWQEIGHTTGLLAASCRGH